jgi:predicted nucleic acid-binding protein
MRDRAFFDTNVLVYAYDKHEPEKQKKAQELLIDAIVQENAVLSVQVLSEFFNAMTRHIKSPMTADEAQSIIATFSVLPVETIDLAMVYRAIDTHKLYRISYWDSLIVAAAERAECKKILTEDLSDGQAYHGIVVSNPFRRD